MLLGFILIRTAETDRRIFVSFRQGIIDSYAFLGLFTVRIHMIIPIPVTRLHEHLAGRVIRNDLAIGRPHEVAHGSLRLTLSEENTQEEVDYIIEETTKVVKYLRDLSPVWKELLSGERKFTF